MTVLHVDGQIASAATKLMDDFGAFAVVEARLRADACRIRGNAQRFCHWRQVERLIEVLATERITGTVH